MQHIPFCFLLNSLRTLNDLIVIKQLQHCTEAHHICTVITIAVPDLEHQQHGSCGVLNVTAQTVFIESFAEVYLQLRSNFRL